MEYKKILGIIKMGIALIVLTTTAAPRFGHAAFCELPHERLLPECSESAEIRLSAIRKKKDVSAVLKDYKNKSEESETMVLTANEEYRAYLEKNPRRPFFDQIK